MNVAYGEKAAPPSDPNRSGYTFAGWYLNGEPYDWDTAVTDDFTLDAVWGPRYISHALLLKGQIGVVYNAEIPEIFRDGTKTYITFEINGNTVSTVQYSESLKHADDDYYSFTCFINSAQMSETITATLHFGEGKTVTDEYSVKLYIDYVNENQGEFTPKVLALVKAIADYGHYMTPFLKAYGSGVPAGTLTEIIAFRDMDDADIDDAEDAVRSMGVVKTDAGQILSETRYALLLGSETTIRIRFKTSDPDAAVTVKKGSKTVDSGMIEHTVDSEGNHVLKIMNINAAQLADRFTVTVEEGGVTATIEVSALSYADTVFRSPTYNGDDTVKNVMAKKAVASLYYYYQAASDYLTD